MKEQDDTGTVAAETGRHFSPMAAVWERPNVDEKLDEALNQTFPARDPFEISA
ncbi:MAG TPA: hypothetical protein VFA72_07500 [Burkholderiales bacterium]|nr:hypothetical protein [Burkholderiales bacterium]